MKALPWRRHPLLKQSAGKAIAKAVALAEERTSAEIVVRIRERCDRGLGWCADKEERLTRQAQADFVLAGVDRTKEGTGVIVLVVLEERGFTIWAENKALGSIGVLLARELAMTLAAHFKKKEFVTGISNVVEVLGGQLAQTFPRRSDDTNELADGPVVG
jgi:uncharacterized membrane protein